MTHSLRSDLWWAIPFRILLDQFWDTLWIPHDQASPSQTHRCPGACGSRQPTGVHGLCFGYCFSGPLPLRSLILGPLSRVWLDYTQKSTTPILALKLSVSAIITPGGLPHHLCSVFRLVAVWTRQEIPRLWHEAENMEHLRYRTRWRSVFPGCSRYTRINHASNKT